MAKITNRKEFQNWLKGQPKEWSQVLAVRIALRVLPLASGEFDLETPKLEIRQNFILSIFRTTCISWAGRKYPTYDVRSAAKAAVAAANAFAATDDATAFTVDAATRSALAARTITATIEPAAHALTAAIAAANALTAAAHGANAAAVTDVWATIDADARVLQEVDGDAETTAKHLAGKGLWLNQKSVIPTPQWSLDALDNLEHHLLQLDDNWQVWIQWYSPLLQGKPGWGLSAKNAEDLIVRITTQDEDFWNNGASKVNAEIAGWLEEFRTREKAEQGNAIKVAKPTGFESLKGLDIVPNSVEAIKKARVNHDQLVLTFAMLRMEIDEFKDKLRGNNEISPDLRQELTAFLDNHAQAVEEMITITEGQPENASDDDTNKFKVWFDTYLDTVKNELPKYTDPKKYGKATIPAIIVGLSASIGLMVGMPKTFAAVTLGMMKFNPAAKWFIEILNKNGDEK